MFLRKSMVKGLPLVGLIGLVACAPEPEAQKLSYQADIRPILEAKCVKCHTSGQEGTATSGLLLDSYDALLKGTKLGPVVVPGSAASSTLYLLVSGKADPSLRMPHDEDPLPEDQVATIKMWIDQGASKE